MNSYAIRKVKGSYFLFEDGAKVSDPYKKKKDLEPLKDEFKRMRAMEAWIEGEIVDMEGCGEAQFLFSKRVVADTIEWVASRNARRN